MTEQGEALLSITEAAQLLGLNKSTVSRFVRDHPELNRAGGRQPRVLLSELQAKRKAETNEAKAGNHAGLAFGEAVDGGELPSQPAPVAGPRLAEERAGLESIRRQRAALELERDLGAVALTSDLEDAGHEIGLFLQAVTDQVFNEDLVSRIRRAPDDRRAAAELETAKERLFAGLDNEAAKSLRAAAGEHDGPDDAGAGAES
ncbi:MAG: helix-turn-helix domain-containing protein [Rhodospirillales bacterium]|jgi:hypothetical protein